MLYNLNNEIKKWNGDDEVMLSIYLAMIEAEDDKTRFYRIYNKYRDSLIRYANSILHNEDAAVDAVHAALFSIAKNIKSLPKEMNELDEKSYVYIAVKNASINELKKIKRTVGIDETVDVSRIADTISPSDSLMAADRIRTITSYISKLPPEYHDTLALYFFHELSCKEISATLNTNVNTIRSRVRQGRIMLEERMRKGD